jgi:glyoxylase-like metal-dependent hydrolase (beta-lactamase superfamily II)
MTMQDGANVSLIVTSECAIAVDLPMQASELADWRAGMAAVTNKPLRWIIFTSPERVSADTLKLLAPVDKPAPKVLTVPTIIQDAGFAQLYTALESSQPRSPEPLSAFELRKRGILPEFTFSEKMTLSCGNPPVNIDILHVDGAMPGSAFVIVREAGLVFAGDHIASDDPPVMYSNSNLDHWIDALTELLRDKKLGLVIPGRGKSHDAGTVSITLDFLKNARSGLRKLAKGNKNRAAVAGLVPGLMAIYHGKNAGETPSVSGSNAYTFSVAGQSLQLGLEQIYDQLLRQMAQDELRMTNDELRNNQPANS